MKVAWVEFLTRWTEPKDKSYRRVIACVAGLLSDTSARIEKNGDRVRVTEVRNVAAKELGELLGVKTEPDDRWSSADWEKFREEVAKAARKQ